jgi:hypothetical protein
LSVASYFGTAAQNNLSPSTSWQLTGNVQAGTAVINSTDQLSVDSANERISGLDSNTPSFSTDLSAVLIDFTYLNPATKPEVYLRAPMDKDLALTVGVVEDLAGWGTVEVSAVAKLDQFVWKDPYVTDELREETRVTNYGLYLRYNDFFYIFCFHGNLGLTRHRPYSKIINNDVA